MPKKVSKLEGKKRVWLDPATQRVIGFEELQGLKQSSAQAGLEQGFQAGYMEGKKKSRELAFGDMGELWTEVAKAHQTASSYAKTLADIHNSMAPKVKPPAEGSAMEKK